MEVISKTGNLIHLTAADVGKHVRIVEPGNVMLQVDMFTPAVGDRIDVEHVSLSRVVFDCLEGATLRYMDRFYAEILGMYGVVSLICVGDNEWTLYGALRPRPEWQVDLDSYPNLSWNLNPIVDVDWVAKQAELDAILTAVISPELPVITCAVGP